MGQKTYASRKICPWDLVHAHARPGMAYGMVCGNILHKLPAGGQFFLFCDITQFGRAVERGAPQVHPINRFVAGTFHKGYHCYTGSGFQMV